jgi:hypothetical protein
MITPELLNGRAQALEKLGKSGEAQRDRSRAYWLNESQKKAADPTYRTGVIDSGGFTTKGSDFFH